jgi:hypothetical protein
MTATGTIVLFDAPPTKLAPHALRAAFAAVAAFAAKLPDTQSPVAALGIAVRTRGVASKTKHWIHAGQASNASRWILTDAEITKYHARLEGTAGAEVDAAGRLAIDPGVPVGIAEALRAAYDTARGVVEPAKLNAALASWCHARGVKLRDGAYLLDTLDADTRAVLDAVIHLGGLASTHEVGGAALAALAAPVQRSIEDEVRNVLASVDAVLAKAKDAARPNGPTMQLAENEDALRSQETAHRDLDDARARLQTWSDRLGLHLADLAARMTEVERVLDRECDRALDAIRARRAARAAARGGEALPGATCDADMGSEHPGDGGSTCVLEDGHPGPHSDGAGFIVPRTDDPAHVTPARRSRRVASHDARGAA